MGSQLGCVNTDRAAVQVEGPALHRFTQTAEQEEQAERAGEQHLHHFDCLEGELTETFCSLKSPPDKLLVGIMYN